MPVICCVTVSTNSMCSWCVAYMLLLEDVLVDVSRVLSLCRFWAGFWGRVGVPSWHRQRPVSDSVSNSVSVSSPLRGHVCPTCVMKFHRSPIIWLMTGKLQSTYWPVQNTAQVSHYWRSVCWVCYSIKKSNIEDTMSYMTYFIVFSILWENETASCCSLNRQKSVIIECS